MTGVWLQPATAVEPCRGTLTHEPIEQKDGGVQVPVAPGLGIDIDRRVIERYWAG